MKTFKNWMLITLCTTLLLIIVLGCILLIPEIINNGFNVNMTKKEIWSSSISFLMIISLLIMGLRNGIKNIKKEKAFETIDYNRALNLELNGQIKYSDYRNLNLLLGFKRPIYLVLFAVILLLSLNFMVNGENMTKQFHSNYLPYVLIGVFFLTPILTIKQINNNYKTNRIFHEKLNYTLTNEVIHIKGETVDSTQKWSNFYQIKETNQFFMFYQSKMIATLIDKNMFSEKELFEFQEFTKSLPLKRS